MGVLGSYVESTDLLDCHGIQGCGGGEVSGGGTHYM
jgi:hypothetical protein